MKKSKPKVKSIDQVRFANNIKSNLSSAAGNQERHHLEQPRNPITVKLMIKLEKFSFKAEMGNPIWEFGC